MCIFTRFGVFFEIFVHKKTKNATLMDGVIATLDLPLAVLYFR